MAEVGLHSVKKSFGKVDVIHGVDVDVADGEFLVLVGPSGCGKSTLLRMIAGLETVSGGEVSIGGRVVNELEPKDRDIAMVFQNYALYPHMNVAKNMGFSLEHRGGSKSEIAERVAWAADILGLSHLLERFPKQLSGGQRQRVAMGRAIVRNPQVFLFDEPLSNLDAKLRVVMRSEIKALHQKLKTTMIYVTHDQIEAMTLADRIVVMHAGKVEQIGSPLELYDRPANRFVAGFIGSPAMNFLPVNVRGGRVLLADGSELADLGAAAPPDGDYVCGIRPEHLDIGANGAAARVEMVEPMGADTQVTVSLAGQKAHLLLRDRITSNQGDTLFVAVRPARVHLFDIRSGKRGN
ncbi:MAG: sn-glycerol-3-phosphate ABC transporter ATP-binding protein UgpC [Alphaproteobacteria bacterium]|nr:sn-glycerol-3-phosphate ABC transporter ATP-binding protein UgpC [Alphaproteobacteria bacterium]